MSLFRNIEFLTTVADTRTLPPPRGAEVAFVGRSNAGKSSAINALANRKKMAFVSKTPGRTQHINFFSVGPDQFLVDLPGYGYAAVPAAERDRWNLLISAYLQNRASLRGVVLIMDARHPMGVLDQQLLDWLQPVAVPVHVLLSKADKLGQQQAMLTLNQVNVALRARGEIYSAQLFSSLRKTGIQEAGKIIGRWLDLRSTNKKPPV